MADGTVDIVVGTHKLLSQGGDDGERPRKAGSAAARARAGARDERLHRPTLQPAAVLDNARQCSTIIETGIRLRVLAKPYGVLKVDAAPGIISITFQKNPPIDPMKIIQLIQKQHIKLAGNEKLRIERELSEAKDRAQMVRDILKSLGQPGGGGCCWSCGWEVAGTRSTLRGC